MKPAKPFGSTDIEVSGKEVLTWYQVLERNHQAHPKWSVARHIAALNDLPGEGDMGTLAALYGTTPEVMITEALKEAS